MEPPDLRPDAMNRAAPLLAVLVLLVAGLSLPAAGAVGGSAGAPTHAAQAGTPTAGENDSGGATAPGAQFAGVVDVQEAEVESELEGRAFGIQVARANSDDSRASVVADEVTELRQRTQELRERRDELNRARENGSITQARYRAEMAALAARSAAVERQLDRSQDASRGLPEDLLESKGVNTTAIERLRNDSRTAAGPDAAGIARSIAGPSVGGGLADDGGGDGPFTTVPGRPGSPTDSNGSAILPDTDEFDTPTVPGSPDVPGSADTPGSPDLPDVPGVGNGSGPPSTPRDPDLPNVGGSVGDVLSPILGDDGAGNETETTTDTADAAGTTSG